MKHRRAITLVSMGCLAAGGTFWLGCGGDDSKGGPGLDGGGDDSTLADSAIDGGNDAPADTSKADTSITQDCTSYCTAIMATCKDALGQYLDLGTCLKMCAGIPRGAAADTSGDTLGCRIYELGLASKGKANTATHCPMAGPYGYGGCGDLCGDFCARYVTQCGAAAWDSGPLCPPACSAIPSSDGGSLDSVSANTIECREYHLENAYANDSGPDGSGAGHCLHAGASGGGICQ